LPELLDARDDQCNRQESTRTRPAQCNLHAQPRQYGAENQRRHDRQRPLIAFPLATTWQMHLEPVLCRTMILALI